MAGSTTEFKWTTDHAAVIRGYEEITRTQQLMARRIEELGRKSEAAAKVSETGWTKVGKALVSTAQGIVGGGGLLTAYNMLSDANREAMREADEVAKRYDTLFRQFRVQAGLNEMQGEQAKQRILGVAARNAVPAEVAQAGASGLVGAGFSTQEATGSALDALLRARAATNATGGTAPALEVLAGNAAGYLASQGKEANAANLESVLQAGFALRKTGRFELEDLSDLASQAATMKGYLSQEEQMAAYGTLRDIMPAAESATGLRNIVSRLSTSRVGRTSKEALSQIGLRPEDVDLVGEDFGSVLDKLQGGLQGIPEAKRAGVLKQLFEEAGVPVAQQLLSERGGRYAEYRRAQGAVGAEYAETVATAQAGPANAEIRQQLRREQRVEQAAEYDSLFRGALEEEAARMGASPVSRSISGMAYDIARGVGVPQDTAAQFAYGGITGATGDQRSDIVNRARNQTRVDQNGPIKVEVVNQPADAPTVRDRPAQALGR